MDITIDQAKAFHAIARCGTIQGAAKALNKGHSAVMYLIKALEEQTQLCLFDRSGYRNQMTPEGVIVLKYCRQLIQTQHELEQVCNQLLTDWEPRLKLIYDGVIDFNPIADALFKLNESQTPTEVKVIAAYLHEVETKFKEENADIMVTIMPIKEPHILSIKLKPIRMLLVAHKEYSLNKIKTKGHSASELTNHTYIKIRGATDQLGLSTEQMDFSSSFLVNDFATKKQAILKKLGYGWLPEYLIKSDLKSKKIQVIKTDIESEHILNPRLYHRNKLSIGRSTKQLIKYFKER